MIDPVYRRRHAEASDRLNSLGGPGKALGHAMVGHVISYGGTPGSNLFHTVRPTGVSGDACPGCLADTDIDTSTPVDVLVLGANRAVNSYLLAKQVDGIWVARPLGAVASPCAIWLQLTGECVYGWYCMDVKDSFGVEIHGYPRLIFWGPGFGGVITGSLTGFSVPGSDTYTVRFRQLNGTASIRPTSCTDYYSGPCPVDISFTEVLDCSAPGPTRTIALVPPCVALTVSGTVYGCFNYTDGVITDAVTATCTGPGTITGGYIAGDNGFSFAITDPEPVTYPVTYTVTVSCPGFLDRTETFTFGACQNDLTVTPPGPLYMTKIDFPVYVCGCTGDGCFGPYPCDDNPLPGATVTLTGGLSGSCTTGADGHCSITLTSPWDGVTPVVATATHTRYRPFTSTVSLSVCSFYGSLNYPIEGYTCACCPEAMPNTLSCTVAGFACDLTRPDSLDPCGGRYGGTWTGILTATVPSHAVTYGTTTDGFHYYCAAAALTSGDVCIHVTFSCGQITLNYYGVPGVDSYGNPACVGPPCQMPCTPLPTNASASPPCLTPCPASTAVAADFECGPFLFTTASPLSWLPGAIVVSE